MEQMITKLGFPIAAAISVSGALWYIVKYLIAKDKSNTQTMNKVIKDIRSDSKEERDLYRESINKFNDKIDKFSLILENNNGRLEVIESDIRAIKEKVEV